VISRRSRGARVLVVAALATFALACGSAERRLEQANSLRVAGDVRGALAAYKAILADLGNGGLSGGDATVRLKALRFAGDVSYLELGDYVAALSYYRRIVSLQPGGREADEARAVIGDIYRDRFADQLAAIAQYAAIASADGPLAPRYQLEVARGYLALGRWDQARTEARILREKWPNDALADEAQLLTAQAWALEKRDDEALGAFQALVERAPRADVKARALEGQAHIHAQAARFDRALELYALALPTHPNPDAIRTNIEAVRERREKAKTSKPGDRAAAFDERKVRQSPREAP
jgi:tetratricopeptide (TPR) repeat protein